MDRNQAARFCKEKLAEYNLDNWHVRVTADPTYTFLGMCSYKDNCIILNSHHVDIHPDEEVKDTILHEVAHALCPNQNHNDIWKAKAIELGARPSPCSHLNLSLEAIDAIRSGATLEIEFEEEIIRRPKYRVTRLQDKCPTCGKVAIEKFNIETTDKNGNTVRLITLECFHIIKKIIPRGTPFESFVSNWWKDEIRNCEHSWIGNRCEKCGEFKLFEFQCNGARFVESAIASQKGALICDEMGLGKTVQALSYIRFHSEQSTPTLYVVKSGVKFQWLKEIYRWLGSDYLAQVISTSKDFVFPNFKSYIISYDLLRRFPREKLEALNIKLVVLDECQQIKNPDSTRTQQVRRIVGNENIKIVALSGTPWKNRGSEFFAILNMISPKKFYSYQGYLDNWVDYYWDGNKRKEGGIRRPEQFKEFVKDIVIRRERTEVMKELPLINRMKLHFQIDDIAQNTYEDEVSDFVKWYNDKVMGGDEDNFDTGMEMLARLSRMRHIVGLAKIPATVSFVEEFIEETDRKLVIFVHHKDVGHLLYEELSSKYGKEIPVMKLTAEFSSEERFDVQERFNKYDRAILIGSTLASGEGLNLQTCADCIMHERQWNPANEEQAEGRFIRIGQTATTVNTTYVEAEETVDTHFDVIVESKRKNFHTVMNNSVAPEWNQTDIIKTLAETIVRKHREKNKGKTKTNIKDKVQIVRRA